MVSKYCGIFGKKQCIWVWIFISEEVRDSYNTLVTNNREQLKLELTETYKLIIKNLPPWRAHTPLHPANSNRCYSPPPPHPLNLVASV